MSRRPQLSATSRVQCPGGTNFPLEGATCELGGFVRVFRARSGRYITKNCNRPAVIQIADVSICARCKALLDAIVADAESAPECHDGLRHPIVEQPFVFRKSA